MRRVIIIGAGFAGLAALRKLSSAKNNLQITVIDKKETFDFLPLLPDVIGRQIPVSCLSYPIPELCAKYGADYLAQGVIAVDTSRRAVTTTSGVHAYDYLIIASGTETNFYGQESVRRAAYALDCARDAAVIAQRIREADCDTYIISGAGYTGIEAASNIAVYFKKMKLTKEVIIIERALAILGPLPEKFRDYIQRNLRKLGVKILCDTSISGIEAGTVSLSSGQTIERAMVIWAAGVKTADFAQKLAGTGPQGRIPVDAYLRLSEQCFAAGDAAGFMVRERPLRMAVYFALAQGACAAHNVICSIRGRPLVKFRPFDPGYIIPLANNASCGLLFSRILVGGIIGSGLHYLLCIYRSVSLKNKLGIVKSLLMGPV